MKWATIIYSKKSNKSREIDLFVDGRIAYLS